MIEGDIMEIKIDAEYASLIPPLTDEEYNTLKESIRTKGLLHPFIVNEQGIVLDGIHRFKALQELGIPITKDMYIVRHFEDRDEEIEFIITSNLHRRQLTHFQRAELAYKLLEVEKRRALKRKVSTLKQFQVEQEVKAPIGSGEPIGKSTEIVAKKVGISHTTLVRAIPIIESDNEELKEKCRRGEIGIEQAYNIVKKKKEVSFSKIERHQDMVKRFENWSEEERVEYFNRLKQIEKELGELYSLAPEVNLKSVIDKLSEIIGDVFVVIFDTLKTNRKDSIDSNQ